MELVPESSQWLSSSWGEVEPLFQNDLITFPSSLPLDGDFSGFTASINPKDAESANCSSFVSPQNPPLDNGMNVDSCDESFKPSFSVPPPAFFPLFLSPSLEAPVHAGSSPSDSVPTRKRRKRDTPPSLLPPPSQVTNLLKLEGVVDSVDSITFESFVAELRNFRSLSTAEESLVKRVTKKIKNRESARKSRQAKKDHNADLETRVSDLVDQTQDLKIQIATLESENRQIRGEISFTENLIISHPLLSKLYFMSAQRDGRLLFPQAPTAKPDVSSQGRPILAY